MVGRLSKASFLIHDINHSFNRLPFHRNHKVLLVIENWESFISVQVLFIRFPDFPNKHDEQEGWVKPK